MSFAIALMLAAETPTPVHLGAYTPNSQLLTWCKSKEPADFDQCWSFIDAVVEATGMPDTTWPKGRIQLPDHVLGWHIIPIVVQHLEQIGPEKMSGPAVRSVYDAVVAAYPSHPAEGTPAKN